MSSRASSVLLTFVFHASRCNFLVMRSNKRAEYQSPIRLILRSVAANSWMDSVRICIISRKECLISRDLSQGIFLMVVLCKRHAAFSNRSSTSCSNTLNFNNWRLAISKSSILLAKSPRGSNTNAPSQSTMVISSFKYLILNLSVVLISSSSQGSPALNDKASFDIKDMNTQYILQIESWHHDDNPRLTEFYEKINHPVGYL